jgi:hypothetical protein
MKLSRLTPCEVFKIDRPKWNGSAERREVGLALDRIKRHNSIEFTYVRKSDGHKSYPDIYYFDGRNVRGLDYEIQNRKGRNLVIIPFTHLEILERI